MYQNNCVCVFVYMYMQPQSLTHQNMHTHTHTHAHTTRTHNTHAHIHTLYVPISPPFPPCFLSLLPLPSPFLPLPLSLPDIYFTSITPSKQFDLLAEDFDYPLIAAVVLGLVVATFVLSFLARRKALRLQWQ